MKIISNYKDYYDFLVGKYGIDEKCVYRRVCSTEDKEGKWWKTGIYRPKHLENPEYKYNFEIIAVCGKLYCCYYYNGKHYFGKDAAEHIPKVIKNTDKYGYSNNINAEGDLAKAEIYHLRETDLNAEVDCPVILTRRDFHFGEGPGQNFSGVSAEVLNPKLADFDFGKVLQAEECFIQISSFLLKEKPVVDNRTDVQKIVGKGFDKKTSFRKEKEK